MRVECPRCQTALEVADTGAVASVSCPSCGSQVHVLPETLTVEHPGMVALAHFELFEPLGKGHYGTVWKARDTRLQRMVAVKVPHAVGLGAEFVQNYLHEARSAARLKHPNIVAVHEVGLEEGRVFIVTDLIEGVSLAEYLAAHRPSPREAAQLCAVLLEALDYAHQQRIIHRDLKPGNILVDGARQPYLTDFGLARHLGDTATISTQGHVLGTPAYMSPEQARGESHRADERSDLFSMGVVLYEMLFGERPFRGGARLLIYQILNDEPQPPKKLKSTVPRDLQTICFKALEKDPARRYASAGEMAADLRRWLSGVPIRARPVSFGERAWRWAARNRLIAALLAAIALLAGVVAAGAAYQIATAPPRHWVQLATVPEGAAVVFMPLDPSTGEPLADQAIEAPRSPVRVRLPPGGYFVVAHMPDNPEMFHEVYRHVPDVRETTPGAYYHQRWERDQAGTITLPNIRLWDNQQVTADMAYLAGSRHFEMGEAPHTLRVAAPPFWLDVHEVPLRKYRERQLSLHSKLVAEKPPDDFPLTYVPLDNAMAYAESVGKVIMNEAQYEFAATNGGTTRFPWGNDAGLMKSWKIDTVGHPDFDRTRTQPPIHGLYSNALEWTCSRYVPRPAGLLPAGHPVTMNVSVRGGPPQSVWDQPNAWRVGPPGRFGMDPTHTAASVGFRCARSARPRVGENAP